MLWNKWLYLDSACSEEQLLGYNASDQAVWDNKYARLDVGEPRVEVEFAAAVLSQVSQSLFSYVNRAKMVISSDQKGFSTSDHKKSYRKRPTCTLQDEYTRHCLLDLVPGHPDGHLT